MLFPAPLAGDPPEDAAVRHARVRAAAGRVERQALGPRGAGVHGDQLDTAFPAANLQHRDVAQRVRGGQERGDHRRRRHRNDGRGREHGHLHPLGACTEPGRSVLRSSVQRQARVRATPMPRCVLYTYGRVAWRPQKLDEGSEVYGRGGVAETEAAPGRERDDVVLDFLRGWPGLAVCWRVDRERVAVVAACGAGAVPPPVRKTRAEDAIGPGPGDLHGKADSLVGPRTTTSVAWPGLLPSHLSVLFQNLFDYIKSRLIIILNKHQILTHR